MREEEVERKKKTKKKKLVSLFALLRVESLSPPPSSFDNRDAAPRPGPRRPGLGPRAAHAVHRADDADAAVRDREFVYWRGIIVVDDEIVDRCGPGISRLFAF
jgi:hypothetical protein